MILLQQFFIEPPELVQCNRVHPQIIKLLGSLLRVYKEAGIDEKTISGMFDRSLDE
jgi:hypothetical protein